MKVHSSTGVNIKKGMNRDRVVEHDTYNKKDAQHQEHINIKTVP